MPTSLDQLIIKKHYEGITKPLSKLCHSITDCHHSTPKYTSAGKIVIRNFNIKNGRLILGNVSFTDEETYQERIARSKPEPGDLIITREAPMGEICIIPEGIECCLGQRMVLIKPNKNAIDNNYLLYAILSEYVQKQIQKSNNTGSIVSNLRIADLKDLQIPIKEPQSQIAGILSALDAKIDLNNRINAELEAMAKTIYDYWFVQFDFPDKNGKPYKSFGGEMVYNKTLKREIPERWQLKKLVELCYKIGDGIHGTPKYIEKSKYSFINGNNLKDGFIWTDNETKRVSKAEYQKYFIEFNENTIFLSINGTLGNLAVFCGEDVMLGKSAAYLNCKEKVQPYCYQFLKMDNIQKSLWNIATGSTIKNLSLESLKSLLIPWPGIGLIDDFYGFTRPIDIKRKNIFKENQQLTQLRDWLLPMLMNGQVTVK